MRIRGFQEPQRLTTFVVATCASTLQLLKGRTNVGQYHDFVLPGLWLAHGQ